VTASNVYMSVLIASENVTAWIPSYDVSSTNATKFIFVRNACNDTFVKNATKIVA
jgi:hypothetical protein